MFRNGCTLVIVGTVLCGGLLTSSLRALPPDQPTGAANNASAGLIVNVEDQHPFTRFAYIPAGSDLSTIKFEKASEVEVPTKVKYTTDTNYCVELMQFRDPGGSMQCPQRQAESPAPALEVTYSFRGPELASDEYGLTYFLFHVYFRQDELGSRARSALSNKKVNRVEKASYFKVSTFREQQQRIVIDEDRSHFCDASPVDGVWTRTDPTCQDRIRYKTITAPSEYVTVRVDPVPTY